MQFFQDVISGESSEGFEEDEVQAIRQFSEGKVPTRSLVLAALCAPQSTSRPAPGDDKEAKPHGGQEPLGGFRPLSTPPRPPARARVLATLHGVRHADGLLVRSVRDAHVYLLRRNSGLPSVLSGPQGRRDKGCV